MRQKLSHVGLKIVLGSSSYRVACHFTDIFVARCAFHNLLLYLLRTVGL